MPPQAKQEQRDKHQRVAAYKLGKEQESRQQRQLQQALEKPKAVISRAEAEARVQRDLQHARNRHDKIDADRHQRQEREEWLKLAAKRAKDFAVADRIRDELRARGIDPDTVRPK